MNFGFATRRMLGHMFPYTVPKLLSRHWKQFPGFAPASNVVLRGLDNNLFSSIDALAALNQ
jgi:hypothetical protein